MQLGCVNPRLYSMRQDFDLLWNIANLIYLFRLCSGLIVTSYSQYSPDDSYKSSLSEAIHQYKNYKKVHVVDEDEDNFIGIMPCESSNV